MADVFCNNCGHRNTAGSNFCSSCGAPLDRAANDEPTTITFSLDHTGGDDIEIRVADIASNGVLVATRGPNAGSEFALGDGTTTLGRHPESDIFLDDVTVSRRHVEVERRDGEVVVRDAGSLNGTYVNKELVEGERTLTNGDELQVGLFKLVFVAGAEG
jgi:pSer/pThr/pTyr-binding forkhead associated (FHA) protein